MTDAWGRLLTFVARSGSNGLGVNEAAAVLYSLAPVAAWGGMNAKVVGLSSAYFVTALGMPNCEAGLPLDGSFRVRRFRAGTTFNFADGWIAHPSAYVLRAQDGSITSTLSDSGTGSIY